MTYVQDTQAHMAACILDKRRLPTYIFFLDHRIMQEARVEKYPRDTWVHSKTLIYPLKIHGEVAPSKSKKKKVNLVKSADDDIDSYWPSIEGLFEKLSSEIKVIRELVPRFPTGPRELSTTRHFYVEQTIYMRFLVDQN